MKLHDLHLKIVEVTTEPIHAETNLAEMIVLLSQHA